MTMTDLLEQTDVELELIFDEVMGCQSKHRSKTSDEYFGPCTIEVVAVWSATCRRGKSLNVCQRAVDWVQDLMLLTDRRCVCERHVTECWTIQPL
jgi:hypothetical protein